MAGGAGPAGADMAGGAGPAGADMAGGRRHGSMHARKRILLLSTGGTIASRVDYRTGAVTPVLSAGDLLETMPELSRIAVFDSEVVTSVYSENMAPGDWLLLARRILERAGPDAPGAGYAGVIVAHGTDTMHYTSAFLSFALAGFPTPIVLTGAQRSPDRASSDAAANLAGAARFITESGTEGVYVAMHMDGGDGATACHIGTRVRKNHTSKRDAFVTIGADGPAYMVSGSKVRGGGGSPFYASEKFSPAIALDEMVALVKHHPGLRPELLGHIIDTGYKAIIFEGTGLGHVGSTLYEQVRRASEKKIFLGMTSQCIDGRTAMTVYESGRDLLSMGVVPLGNMIPEVALVKAMWAAGNFGADEIREIMLRNISSEMAAD